MDPNIHQRRYAPNDDDRPPPQQYPVYDIRVDPNSRLRVPGADLPESVTKILIVVGALSFLVFLYLFMGYKLK